MADKYSKDRFRAQEAQELAHLIAFGPVVFQITRIMLKEGVFDLLRSRGGCTIREIAAETGFSEYAVKVLMESSLTLGTVLLNDGKYSLSKAGWFVLTDPMVRVNIDFNHDINYKGMFSLDEALRSGKPAGLRELGPWETIYEGLSQLRGAEKEAWFGFDHFYSDNSFDQALPVVFASGPSRILDIGGNTGKWAMKCVEYDSEVRVTIADLPGQIAMMRENVAGSPGCGRIDGVEVDMLDSGTELPGGYDAVWMSQFLDCFAEDEVVAILRKAGGALAPGGRIFIMETLWDRQKYRAAAFDVAQTSVYFTAMANGNSKMFGTEDLKGCIGRAGLRIDRVTDGLGYAHSILECVPAE